jgi:3-phenylpropionate/trans-cinnamate dioxygenase ferredoxin reductase subunit
LREAPEASGRSRAAAPAGRFLHRTGGLGPPARGAGARGYGWGEDAEEAVLLESIVIVGGSLAGIRSAEALRRLGFAGRLALVGAELRLPYDRPPLSKEVLRGARDPDSLSLVKPEALAALGLELHLGGVARGLDLGRREVVLEGDRRLPFQGLVIATGATPRRLPGTPALAGIGVLRTLDDCLALRAELERSPRVVVVGAGFIGAEVAATCRQRGLDVTLLETLPVPLGASVPREIGETLASIHRDAGVRVRCGVRVEGFTGGARVEGVRLAGGERIPADLVVLGIGVTPETRWLEGSGLPLGDGVLCDESLAAGAPDVVAAGDVARWTNPLFGESMRVEHWTNAVEQASAAAERLLAGPAAAKPFATVPFVWSDQYDRKLQIAGRIRPEDEMRIVHGTLAERRCVALFGRAGRLVGALAINRPRQLVAARRQIRESCRFEDAVAQAEAEA